MIQFRKIFFSLKKATLSLLNASFYHRWFFFSNIIEKNDLLIIILLETKITFYVKMIRSSYI